MEIGPNDPDFRFRVEPSPDDRALQRLAADLGADIVINHHPHVLQGFESYDGKLIAHSLGNFLFDLSYAETFPTMVLTLEIDKKIMATLRAGLIDDHVPQPATASSGDHGPHRRPLAAHGRSLLVDRRRHGAST
jgi:poly-gamma-glutamate capsule biosynthesis protein CapA/YwtB (metallophosphatase superfamily)